MHVTFHNISWVWLEWPSVVNSDFKTLNILPTRNQHRHLFFLGATDSDIFAILVFGFHKGGVV